MAAVLDWRMVMEISFTAYLWLNWLLVGFFVGVGLQIAAAIYAAILWVLGQRRPPAS